MEMEMYNIPYTYAFQNGLVGCICTTDKSHFVVSHKASCHHHDECTLKLMEVVVDQD